MRTFNFKAKNIGNEKYLSYTMDDDCDLDEDALDYCEENNLKELIEIIYEEDDDYDYLTYNITNKVSIEEYIKNEMNASKVLNILRNIAINLISLKEQAIHLSYILLNRGFMYVNDDCSVQFICVPVEIKGSVVAEFKGFMRQLLANMKYDIDEELGYVGKLLTYINSDNFNLRGLVGLSEALMEEAGISFNEAEAIETDGVEVINNAANNDNIANIMGSFDNDAPLPEIGDDEEDEPDEDYEESENVLPESIKSMVEDEPQPVEEEVAEEVQPVEEEVTEEVQPAEEVQSAEEVQPAEKEVAEEVQSAEEGTAEEVQVAEETQTVQEEAAEEVQVTEERIANEQQESSYTELSLKGQKETDIDVIKNRIKQLVGEVPEAKTQSGSDKSIKTLAELDQILDSRPPVIKKNVVKVNRAALIQNLAAEQEAEIENQEAEAGADDKTENIKVPVIEDVYDGAEETQATNATAEADNNTEAPQEAAPVANGGPKAIPYLIRVNTEERIMLDRFIFKIGKATRGVNYRVAGNSAISRQHAVIIQNDDGCFIKDNKSTNHTYVNGKIVEDGVEERLLNDCMITLGDEDFIFKIY